MRRALTSSLLVVLLVGCRGREARQLGEAIETFVDFGLSNEERPRPAAGRSAQTRSVGVRSRSVHDQGRAGPELEVVVDLSHALDGGAVTEVMTRELDLLSDEPYPLIRLIGQPAGLVQFGGFMGLATVRRGQGGVQTRLCALVRDDAPPLTDDQYNALVDLELATAGRPSAGARAEAQAAISARHGADVLREALSRSNRRYSRLPRCPGR